MAHSMRLKICNIVIENVNTCNILIVIEWYDTMLKHVRLLQKRITDESPETLTKPGTPEDVRALMIKVLKDKVKGGQLEDCLLDSGSLHISWFIAHYPQFDLQ